MMDDRKSVAVVSAVALMMIAAVVPAVVLALNDQGSGGHDPEYVTVTFRMTSDYASPTDPLGVKSQMDTYYASVGATWEYNETMYYWFFQTVNMPSGTPVTQADIDFLNTTAKGINGSYYVDQTVTPGMTYDDLPVIEIKYQE